MKKILIGLLGLFLMSACGGRFIKVADPDDVINTKEYGVLIFSVTFKENKFQEKELYMDLEGDMGGAKELRVDPGDDQVFAFVVKEGYYRIKDIMGTNNSPAITRAASDKEEREIYTERQWAFPVEAGKITYAGNIFIKDFDHQEGLNTKFYVRNEVYTLSANMEIRNRLADIARAKEDNPVYGRYNLPVTAKLMEEADSEKSRALNFISQKKQDQMKEGYGDFNWGTFIEEVKSLLEQNKKQVLVLSTSHLIDNTKPQNPVEYFFMSKEDKQLLQKVLVHLDKKVYDQVMTSLIKKYGKASKQDGETTLWFTSYSKIALENKENEMLLTYEGIGVEQAPQTNLEDLVK